MAAPRTFARKTARPENAERATARPDDTTSARRDGHLPVERYAAIGDGGTLALVGLDGAIDWMCLPHRDSPSVFGALLDARAGGRFTLQPAIPFEAERAYVPQTNVLQHTFRTAAGAIRVTDALTLDRSATSSRRELVRRAECLAGTVPLRWHFEPRFGYGRRAAALAPRDDAILARDGTLQLALQHWDAGEPEVGTGAAAAEIELSEGECATLRMAASAEGALALARREHVERRSEATVALWRSWVSSHSYDGPWVGAVERSLLAIRTLTDGRTGAIAAAGTTSLPEVIDGERNFDYRYGWVRDLSFTLDALLSVGIEEPTEAALGWLLEATSHTHPRVDPVYRLDGTVLRSQSKLPLPGYRGTTPVHEGNSAGTQLQLGGFGDFVETIAAFARRGNVIAPAVGERLADIADLVCLLWRNRDAGLWELGEDAHYTTSKVGCWAALERVLDLAARGLAPARNASRWRAERAAIRAFVESGECARADGPYRFRDGSDALDCATLLAARRGFADPRGERFIATIDAIRRELAAEGPLLYRYSGMQEEENAFLACSFWTVEALALAERVDEAAEMMDRMVALGNDVGLYSEEMEPNSHAMRGNFPQALTHLALLRAASALSEAQLGAGGAPAR